MPAEPAYVPSMPPALMTADELLRVRIPGKRVELVRGVLLVREPAGARHGAVAMELARRLANHVHDAGLGTVYAAETGFALARGPYTVRAPDVAFICGPRLRAHVYRDDGTEQILGADLALDGEGVVPGFSCVVGEVV